MAAAEVLPLLSVVAERAGAAARNAAGRGLPHRRRSELLRRLHRRGSYSRLTLDVVSQDIRPLYARYSAWRFPELVRVHDDVASLDKAGPFDIVLCSHTLQSTWSTRLRSWSGYAGWPRSGC